ncbi:carbon-nitrogen hydrolase family protein [Allosediminivita pacifica]|uniref:Putative amidohydrolase n=1 Tax=Allosediminivita pacifica TaxID=1267769 RepID=A0A2T6BAC3_9RHOB|nr:carbon-nitrogen hydrolase family protein [Allosediminivita pacifica]PTX52976.1 putative amidohydrolase [Allosediminivita pacifica]GGA94062.1 nitrilase [Allosediminivita pacifica]
MRSFFMREAVQASVVQHRPAEKQERQANIDFILATLADEAKSGAELVVFPEVGITNFFRHGPGGMRDLWETASITLDSPEIEVVRDAARRLNLYTVVGFNERSDTFGVVYNSSALIGPEGVVGVSRKQNFPGVEKLYYTPGPAVKAFDCGLGRVGTVICYDALFPEIARQHFLDGAEMIVFSSSFWRGGARGGVGDPETKRDLWHKLPFVTAVQNQAFVLSANCCGTQDLGGGLGEWERMGLSQIASPASGVLAEAGQTGQEILRATLKRDDLLEARTNYRFLSEVRSRPSGALAV